MNLLHYSTTPLILDRQRGYFTSCRFKPTGLWVSVEGDDDWRTWCESEDFGLGRLRYVSKVTLKPSANVLIIDSVSKLDKFDTRFALHDKYFIEWKEVQALYDGLIIAPYQWSRRYDLLWYSIWDCASGVIWDLSAISNVKPNMCC